MNEDTLRMELQRSMMLAGLEYHHPEDSKRTDSGRPDILSISGAVIEVKKIEETSRIEPWFDPKKISKPQRRQLDYYSFGRGIQTYLAIGTTFGRPRRMWVIPWKMWVALEFRLVDELVSDNPLMIKPIAIEKFRILISKLEVFKEYEMVWTGKSVWKFPFAHPILMLSNIRLESEWEPHSIRFEEIIK